MENFGVFSKWREAAFSCLFCISRSPSGHTYISQLPTCKLIGPVLQILYLQAPQSWHWVGAHQIKRESSKVPTNLNKQKQHRKFTYY